MSTLPTYDRIMWRGKTLAAMNETITPAMIQAASATLDSMGIELRGDPDLTETEIFAAIFRAMEAARTEDEESARRDRSKAPQS